jgi:hypothetical protein
VKTRSKEPSGPPASATRAAAALLVATSGCAAHLPRSDERVPFLERSYASVASDRRQAFEVAPALHLVARNGLDEPGVRESGGVATSLSLSFLGTLRMLREASAPVRTPTYEPRARLQVFYVGRPQAEGAGPPWLAALELTVGHRSNGQQGCALADHVRTGKGDFDCAPTTDPPSDRLDLSSGSFTTNYAGAGVGVLREVGAGRARTILLSRAPRSLGIGLFVRLHQGRDDLNIRFEERLDAWIAGIVVEPGAQP